MIAQDEKHEQKRTSICDEDVRYGSLTDHLKGLASSRQHGLFSNEDPIYVKDDANFWRHCETELRICFLLAEAASSGCSSVRYGEEERARLAFRSPCKSYPKP